MPAVLAEVSFVSSPADEDQLQSSSYRQQIAEALYKGVAKYREEIAHTKVASARRSAPLNNPVILSEVAASRMRSSCEVEGSLCPPTAPTHLQGILSKP